VIHAQTPFRRQFFEIPEAKAETKIPSDASDDHAGIELAVPEQRRPAGLHNVTLPDPKLQHFPSMLFERELTTEKVHNQYASVFQKLQGYIFISHGRLNVWLGLVSFDVPAQAH
jgi:hypothetical protein